MSPAFYKRFHVFVFREICVSRGGPQPHSPQHQAREAWEFSHFPRHAATARKTAPLQKLKRSFGLRSVRGIVVAPWRWRRVFRSATDREAMSWAESAAPDASPTCRTGPQDSYATAIVGSVGADSNADGTQSTRSPPLTSSYNRF